MSPITDIQKRFRELGRIRMGKQVASGSGKMRPAKLDTWRLTSASRELLDVAAENYGGTVQEWDGAPGDGDHYELVTETDRLDIVIPPGKSMSQWMEMWAGGGCKKRCDGARQVLVDRPCSCPSDISERMELASRGEACKPTTRLNVILPKIPDIGVWRLETHGYIAASELAIIEELSSVADQQGRLIPAQLRLDKRTVKRPGKAPNHFAVPVVESSATLGEILESLGQIEAGTLALERPVERRSLPGAPPDMPKDPSFVLEHEPIESASFPGEPPAPESWGAPEDLASDVPPSGDGAAASNAAVGAGGTPAAAPTSLRVVEGDEESGLHARGLSSDLPLDSNILSDAIRGAIKDKTIKLSDAIRVSLKHVLNFQNVDPPTKAAEFKRLPPALLVLIVKDLGLEERVKATQPEMEVDA